MTSSSSQNIVDVLVSEGLEIYTQVTSILHSITETSRTQSTTTSAASSRTSDSSPSGQLLSSFPTSTSQSSSSSSTATASSSSNSITSSASNGAAASSSVSSSSSSASSSGSVSAAQQSSNNGGGGHNNHLGIILGSVLGALALGLLILTLLLCCRRRRRRSRRGSVRNSALTPGTEEIDGWRHPRNHSNHDSEKTLLGAGAGAGAGALAAGRHHSSQYSRSHENPFTPVPPPPRRSAQNSRPGLTDGTVPGDDPYLMETGTGRPITADGARSRSSSSKGKALAMGLGGAALGGAAMHHHNRNKSNPRNGDSDAAFSRSEQSINRKPLRGSGPNGVDSWAPEPPPAVFAGANGGRQSFESARSRQSRDAARANATFDTGYAPMQSSSGMPESHDHHGFGTAAAAAGAGALGGAALARHHHDKEKRDMTIGNEHPSGSQSELNQPASSTFDTRSDYNTGHGRHELGEAAAAGGAGALGGATLSHHHGNQNDRNAAFRNEGATNAPESLPHPMSNDLQTGTTHDRDSPNHHGLRNAALAGGAGAIGGAALAHHRNYDKHEDDIEHQGQSVGDTRDSFAPTTANGSQLNSNHTFDRNGHHGPGDAGLAGGAGALGGAALPRHRNENQRDTGYGGTSEHDTSVGSPAQENRDSSNINSSTYSDARTDAHGHDMGTALAAGGAGALGGAMLARHHHHNNSNNNRQQYLDSPVSRDPPNNALLASHQHDSDVSKASTSAQYTDAFPHPSTYPNREPIHELPTDIPATPPTRPRGNSALGAGAPPAAVGSYFSPAHPSYPRQSQSRSRSNSRPRSRSSSTHSRPRSGFPDHPDDYAAYYPGANTNNMPPLPSRSPRRTPRTSADLSRSSFGYESGRYSSDPFPSYYPPTSFDGSGSSYPPVPPPPSNSPPYVNKSIVGDNGYPHMGVPRRRSGSEYDYSANGTMGPQAVPRDPLLANSGTNSSNGTMSSDSAGSGKEWRVSHGMPGGWSRPMVQGARMRGDGMLGSPVSPIDNDEEAQGGFGNNGRMRQSMQQHDWEERGVGQAL